MPQYRPFKDGLSEAKRRRLRREFWKNPPLERQRPRWTEKLCTECRRWIRREDPCEHLATEVSSRGPAVHTFRPGFHPNAQPGGVWINSEREYRECLRLNGKEPAY